MVTNLSFVHDCQSGQALLSSASQDLVAVLRKIVQNASTLLEVPNCSVSLLDAAGATLVTLSVPQEDTLEPHLIHANVYEKVTAYAAQQQERLIINDVKQDARFHCPGLSGSLMCVPLIDGGTCIGVLIASTQNTEAFSEKKMRLLAIFAEQAVLAIANARHDALARQQKHQLEMLMHLTNGMTTSLEAEAFYRTLLLDVCRLITCTHATLYLYQERTQDLAPVAYWSGDAVSLVDEQQIRILSGPDAQGEAGQYGKISLYQTDSLAAWAALHRHSLVRTSIPETECGHAPAELATPFVSKGELYGVLVLQREGTFNREELALMRDLSHMVAAALENGVLFHKVRADRDATRTQARFLSMITHELRSPLNTINGYLDLILTGVAGELNPQLREFIQRARSGSEHLFALVEDLLLVARADSGQLRLSREVINLEDVIVNAVEEMELTAQDNGISISVKIADEFPPLLADTGRLQQVLRNLLSNALRFTASGGQVSIAAWVEGEEEQQLVKLQVKDTGCGITPAFQERIFERFFQAPNTQAVRSSGQGLGLAIVKMIVELHGGYVTVESVLEQGSTFTCVLPTVVA